MTTIDLVSPDGKVKTYGLVILKVDSYDEFDRASKVTVGYDDTEFKVSEGMAFWTAFVPVEMINVPKVTPV